MTRQLKDLSKSVHDRLLNLAKETARPFGELFQLYAMERFLFRLSQSNHSEKFVLKGGLMLRVWNAPVTRPTKDVDLLGRTKNTIKNLVTIVQEICKLPVAPDGMRFDSDGVVGALIKEDAEYNGVRVKFIGYLGPAKASMQIDVGFGDSTVPAPVEVEVPPLLDFPAPKLRAYRRETTIAEKVHAMTILGTANGRMKDFYDLWLLSENFEFDRQELRSAIDATFGARSTAVEVRPVALTTDFAESPEVQQRWLAFLRKSGLLAVTPQSFAEVIGKLQTFLGPLLEGPSLSGSWPCQGPWSV